ncbi:alkene reductase [Aliiglaciecola sp. LCG003]|uniref:alkene reductase n=1 Tax=Aliiglaciecola sp. LCG003 TaxID=3053655 RepID=UPI0025729EFB|nr:alkene reductase [Aliiglaciecola sp. LCG003]WJG08562.1 alkene reductase [Aliiglaciecola sp. LCG003]
MSELFTPVKLGDINLQNRVIMAPLTRCRATVDHIPTDRMATYYGQRAGAGLIIAEATMAIEGNSAFYREPGIYSDQQVAAWRKVTDEVHQQGGKIFLQIWHGGRACHPVLNDGATPVAPSPIAIDGEVHTPEGKKAYVQPESLTADAIHAIVEGFAKAAINAKAAGFDGVEVHGANGYLLDQFLRDGSNKRDDQYGGSLENRSRLLFEVLDAVINIWGSGRVGLRLSPLNSFNSMIDSDPMGMLAYVVEKLNSRKLAYLHMMRADFQQKQTGDVIAIASKGYQGNLIGNMGYDQAEASQAIEKGSLAAVAFGSAYIANPDLAYRFKNGVPLQQPDEATFYTHGDEGYIDYPTAS